MSQKAYHRSGGKQTRPGPGRAELAVGVDVGATLAKLAIGSGPDAAAFELLPADASEALRARIEALAPRRLALAGAGAPELARRLSLPARTLDEFRAWHAGAAALLQAHSLAARDRYLLVSLGTGTSVLLSEGRRVARVGGTALGGGTLLGLGSALLGARSFDELAALAARGRRERVDLRVADIDPIGALPLPPGITASNFGKLGRGEGMGPLAREDLAHALVGMVAENVALLCAALARTTRVSSVVIAGATLRGNPALAEIATAVLRALDCEPLLLPSGEFAGALGALLLAEAPE